MLLGAGWIRAAWMFCLFGAFGFSLVVVFRWWGGWHPIIDMPIVTLVSLLVTAPLGFLAGIGAFDYWAYYALGFPTRPEDHSGHGARSWKDYFRVNTDHKVIGVQYLTTTIFFFFAAGCSRSSCARSSRAPACSSSTRRRTTGSSPSTPR